ncbi:Ragulator complex protein LAMTOR2 [Echinococcus granulosus]|uniref:Mitogen-activated protein-binding protein-interacting protein n=1 Tax=Echinococcus granulosus TaxID=6210 RepID=U6J3R0_ECHGR|nr:Mitogen-activated protein-binding protein-interacting protein [Echinococcus granulosus]EUB63629.1 Mitogen-activated protein-binding protein-interacting protein [Echinococcus granulosus]KAH9287285.1 Ragulator complex protein LAMTOR2 [Echinococcus granulosus]CDS16290.1 ragulator complex protein LAMTOR2 [Echinococcus granulosus]
MLRLRALSRYLDRVRTGGVESIMLFSTEGILLTQSGIDTGNVKTAAAIVSNVWNMYQKQLQLNESESLQEIIVELTNGRLVFTRVASVIICIYGSKKISLALMRAKMSLLAENLHEPLSLLTASN